jgi:hypothetical protein
MKRTKDWWSRLPEGGSWFVWNYERSQNKYGGMGGYLPDDCSECVICSLPMLGSGTCTYCDNEYDRLIKIGNNETN